ncbi:MAG: pentapeptide repeat-containing protein [Deltaproteobacteria bacterium]|nr:pentapeptide repeat-containing protein [Deltaproteobacteria bacterium]
MELNKEIFTKLKENVVAFRNFNDGEMLEVLKSTQREVFQDNEIVFKEGTRGDKMYIIIAGSVRITRNLGRNQEEVLAKLENGQLFGEMGPIDQSPRSARATASGITVLLSLREAILRENNLGLAYKLYKNFSVMLAERLRATNERLTESSIAGRDTSERMKNLVKTRIEKGMGIKGVDLRGANLTEVFMANADIKDSLMIGAKLNNARMKGANLQNCKLINADFTGADLSGANFTGSDFSNSKFNNANFTQANLTSSNFTASDFTTAIMPDSMKKAPPGSEVVQDIEKTPAGKK